MLDYTITNFCSIHTLGNNLLKQSHEKEKQDIMEAKNDIPFWPRRNQAISI